MGTDTEQDKIGLWGLFLCGITAGLFMTDGFSFLHFRTIFFAIQLWIISYLTIKAQSACKSGGKN